MSIADLNAGYPALSQLMGEHNGLGMFKRFAKLNTRNLLYMQAELLRRENELEVLTRNDCVQANGTSRQSYHRNAKRLSESILSSDTAERAQWEKVLEIRSLLKEYNAALLQYAAICELKDAKKYDFEVLASWLDDNPLATDAESRPWKKSQLKDMKDISGGRGFDPLTTVIAERFIPSLYQAILHRFKKVESHGLPVWSDDIFYAVGRIITVLMSALFPSTAVIALYFVPKLAVRLWMILGFSMLFSGVLALFTMARPIEIFAATAACASVQVVFVGSTNTGRNITAQQ